jgi:hypothetical protein
MIPKRLHYVWVGGPLPDRQRAYLDTWRETNPDYEIVRWNEDNIDMKVPAIARAYARRRWATVADIVRLIAVERQGGIYLDTDIELRQPLDPLLQHRCFFAFQYEHHPTDWVCNGVLGAEAGHPVMASALQAVMRMRPAWFGLDRPTRYGPKLITRLLLERGLRHYSRNGVTVDGVFVCPTHWFFPYAYGETFREDLVTPETLGVHFWEGSWKKDVPAPIRWAQAARHMLANGPRRLAGSRT